MHSIRPIIARRHSFPSVFVRHQTRHRSSPILSLFLDVLIFPRGITTRNSPIAECYAICLTAGWTRNRAHKLAQREEREMDACTFQPNAKPQRGTPSSDIAACRADIARGFPRSSAKTRGSSDCEADSVAGGSSAVASKCKTDSETRKSRSNVCGSGSGGGDIVGGDVGKRLFEEHKRLKERRFEREERKRMQEEEAYARTCTFKV